MAVVRMIVAAFVLTIVQLACGGAGATKGVPSGLLYGGILKHFERTTTEDPSTRLAILRAIEHVRERLGACDDGLQHPRVSMLSKQVLHYTRDGLTPLVHMYRDHRQRIHRRQVIMGINYYFNLEWDMAVMRGPFSSAKFGETQVHRFVITRNRDHSLHVLKHVVSNLDAPPRWTHQRFWATLESSFGDWKFEGLSKLRAHRLQKQNPLLRLERDIAGRIITTFSTLFRGTTAAPVCFTSSSSPCLLDAAAFTATPSPSARSGLLNILSYNIWNINGFDQDTYWKRLDILGSQMRQSNADIIVLQEVRHDAIRDSQPTSLGRQLLEYQFVYQPAMMYPEQIFGRVEEGPAIYSKYPILKHSYMLLPRNMSHPQDSQHQRVLLHVTVSLPTGPVHVFVTHLSLSEEARDASVVAMYDYMQQFTGPRLLFGDLNAEPQERAMRFLAGEEELHGITTEGMFDAFRKLHPEPRPGNKYSRNETDRDFGLTFNVLDKQLCKRIDYCFVLAESDQTPAVCSFDVVPKQRNATKLPASDHLGIQLTLSLNPALPCAA
eukprot:m.234902 g.234902  ORF g.234902 m.234902 type:complete len:550 (+) comp18920_c1_seq8:341-1990(+)